MYCFFLVGLTLDSLFKPSFSVGFRGTFQKLPCQGRRGQSSRLRCLSWSLPQRWGVSCFGVLFWKATGFCGETGVRMICHVSTHINDVYIYIYRYTYSKLIDSYISIYYVYIYVYIHINLNLLHDTTLHHCQRKTRHFLLKNRSHFYYFPIRNCCGNHHPCPWIWVETSRFQADALPACEMQVDDVIKKHHSILQERAGCGESIRVLVVFSRKNQTQIKDRLLNVESFSTSFFVSFFHDHC